MFLNFFQNTIVSFLQNSCQLKFLLCKMSFTRVIKLANTLNQILFHKIASSHSLPVYGKVTMGQPVLRLCNIRTTYVYC